MEKLETIEFNGLVLNIQSKSWNKVIPENQKTIKQFDKININKGNKESTRKNDITILIRFGKTINKPFKEVTRQELNHFIDSLNVQSTSKGYYINPIRRMYKWLYDSDKPEIIKNLKPYKKKKNQLKKSDLLTEDEVKKIISSYSVPCEKAYVSVLFDTACRPHELNNLKRRDVTNQNGIWILSVDGKTGVRNLGLNFSGAIFETWYNQFHPYKDNPDAPLWIARANKLKNQPIEKQGYTTFTSWRIIKNGEKVVNKRLFPYLFRHSRLTNLADKGLQEFKMRNFAGWTPGSKMTETYLHASGKDVMDTVRRLDDNLPEEIKPISSPLKPIECPRCKHKNSCDSEYCSMCWIPLRTEIIQDELQMVEYLRSIWAKNDKETVKICEEVGIPFYYDLDKRVKEYQNTKKKVIKRINEWKGTEEDKVFRKFYGDDQVNAWVETG